MATKKSYTISTGDTLTDVRDNTGNFLSATFANLHIPEYKRTFDVTRNNYTGEIILARWWKEDSGLGRPRPRRSDPERTESVLR